MSKLSQNDLYVLARAFAKMPTDGLECSTAIRLMLDHIDFDTDDGYDLARKMFAGHAAEIFAIDPKTDPPKPDDDDSLIYVPDLPEAAQVTDEQRKQAARVGAWLNDFMEWSTSRCQMTPRLFLEAGGIWVVALAIARRVVLRLDFDEIYPHMYTLWVAPTSYYRKSTGLKAVTHLVSETIPHLLLASQSTPEMLLFKLAGQRTPNYDQLAPYFKNIDDMGRRFAGQRGIIADEAGKLLFSSKKYMEGLAEVFMELFDAPTVMERELRSEGKLIIWQPAVSILGATTPARMHRNVQPGDWEDGNLARIALLTPTESEIKRGTTSISSDDFNPPKDLKRRLYNIYQTFPQPPEMELLDDGSAPPKMEARSMLIDRDALAAFNVYADAMHEMTSPHSGLDERLKGNYSRLPVMALKIAMNLTVMDWNDSLIDSLTITPAHWYRAQLIAEEYRASAHRLIAQLSKSEDIENEERVLQYIKAYNDRQPSEREIHQGTRIRYRKDLQAAITALIDDGLIIEVERAGKRGPVTKGYVLAENP